MSSLQTRLSFTPEQIAQFQEQGYLIVENLLSSAQVEQLIQRFEPLFNTQFETGIYPDEWYGRPGLSEPNSTQYMAGLWRCDRTAAAYALSGEIARLNATLMGWDGGRYGIDACWIKPPNAPEVSFHRNNTYVSVLDPSAIVTCWIGLSHVVAEAGTLEIVPGSHRWRCSDTVRFLHVPIHAPTHAPREDYRAPLLQAAKEAGVTNLEITKIEISPGSAVFLHGDLWHGSGRNRTRSQTRRSFAVSTLPARAQFQPLGVGAGYIFNRYRNLMGDQTLDESFYPILWTKKGYKTAFVENYCRDVLAP
ncbi:MAG: phytanoyl-CoA dioxygenase family protein [Cyanobacteria bacterium J06621_11]